MTRERGSLLSRTGHWLLITGYCLSCGVTPLTNKIKVGEEPFVIAVGEGVDGMTDLFAAPAGGGSFTRLTFNRPEERFPHLSPDGSMVAFLRSSGTESGGHWLLVVQNLLTNAERAMPLPGDAGEPERLGWDRDGKRVVVSAAGYFAATVPPAAPVLARFPADSLPLADSLSREVLGDPPQGVVQRCMNGAACILAADGALTLLDSTVAGAMRWGADSVGYFVPGGFEVRPLRGGRSRRPLWTGAPAGLRQLTYHAGTQVTTSSGVSGIR